MFEHVAFFGIELVIDDVERKHLVLIAARPGLRIVVVRGREQKEKTPQPAATGANRYSPLIPMSLTASAKSCLSALNRSATCAGVVPPGTMPL
jgi:hypothetical protein